MSVSHASEEARPVFSGSSNSERFQTSRLLLRTIRPRRGRTMASPSPSRSWRAALAADLRAAADRAAWVAGLRDLAEFLAAHPDVPVPPGYHSDGITVFPEGGSDDDRRAAVDQAAGCSASPRPRPPVGITGQSGASARSPSRWS